MADAKKDSNRLLFGLFRFIKSPSHLYPLAFLLAYAVLFGLYNLRFVPNQRAALLDGSFRRLALASDQIRSRMENIAQVMRAEADRLNAGDLPAVSDAKGERHFRAEDGTAPIKDFSFTTCDEQAAHEEGIRFQVLPGDKPMILVVLQKANTHLCGVTSLEGIIEAATHDLVGTGFEDIAVTTSAGRVIYQDRSSALRLATLADLPVPDSVTKHAASDDKSESGKEKRDQSGLAINYSRLADLTFAERKYKLLLQPIVLPISDFASSASNAERSPSLELIGMIDESTLTAQARSLPYDWLINITGTILLCLVLFWPVLKIWKMGPAEGFRPRETLIFGLSMIAAAILVTVLVYYNTQVFNYESSDTSLANLANSIDKNFQNEVSSALRTLQQVTESDEVKPELTSLLATHKKEPFHAYPAVLGRKKFFLNGSMPSPYRWFYHIFWTDEQGNQLLKWSTHEKTTGRTRVSEEPWFQKVAAGHFWNIDCGKSQAGSLVLDSIYSPNTTDYFGVIAQVRAFNDRRVVATIVTPFVSVINPLLPPMDGFAILDEKGLVRFHSDPAKNLRENFLNEIRPSQQLKAAINTRSTAAMTLFYQTKKYRVALRPISFERNEGWTIVVFRDLTLRQRFFLNVLVLTIIYIVCYLFAMTGLTMAGIFLIRLAATWRNLPVKEDWLRPTANERYILWGLVSLFLCLLALFRFLTGPDHSQSQYVGAVVGLPLLGLLATYFALRYAPAMTRRNPKATTNTNHSAVVGKMSAPRSGGSQRLTCRLGAGSVLGFALTLLLTLVAVFPTAEFFELAFSDSMVPNLEDMQLAKARNILARNDRIYSYVRSIPTSTGSALEPDPTLMRARLSETLDRYTLTDKASSGDGKQISTTLTSLDYWLPDPSQHIWSSLGKSATASWCFRNTAFLLSRFIPFPETIRDNVEIPGSWKWQQGRSGQQAVLEMRPPQPDPQDPREVAAEHSKTQDAALGDFPITDQLRPFRHHSNCGVIMAALLVLLFWFIRYTVLMRFGLDFRPSGNPNMEATLAELSKITTCNLLALTLPRRTNPLALAAIDQSSSAQVIAWETLLGAEDWRNKVADTTELIVVSDFEAGLKDAATRPKTLDLLEELVEDPKRKLLLVSTLDPVYYLYSGRFRGLRKLSATELDTYSRWLNALNSFETRRVPYDSKTPFTQEEWHALWDTCSEREQIALWQLAKYHVINPKNSDAVEHLHQRGILIYREDAAHFETFDEGFKKFVTSDLTGRQVQLLMSYHTDTAWNGLKWVFIYTGLALPFFVAFTTADFWDLGIGKLLTFGSAGAATIQTISRFAEVATSKTPKGGSVA